MKQLQFQPPGKNLIHQASKDYLTDQVSDDLVARFRRLVRWRPNDSSVIVAALIPEGMERTTLNNRLNDLYAMLLGMPGDRKNRARIAAAILDMLGGGYSALINLDKRKLATEYTIELEHLPAWAIERACLSARQGKIEGLSPDFPPTAPRLHQLVDAILDLVRVEQAQIVEVLSFVQEKQESDAAEQERMRATAAAWLDRHDHDARAMTECEDAERAEFLKQVHAELLESHQQQIIEAYRARGEEPVYSCGVLISPFLRDQVAKN